MNSASLETSELSNSGMSSTVTGFPKDISDSTNIGDYSNRLKAAGLKVLAGSQGTVWIPSGPFLGQVLGEFRKTGESDYGPLVMQRRPYFALHPPSRDEIHTIFRRSRAALLSFSVDSCEVSRLMRLNVARRPILAGQGYLYVCRDPRYSLEKLGQSARSHIRRSFNAFQFRFADQSEVLRLGMQAFIDTRARFGLRTASPQAFEHQIRRMGTVNRYMGAFQDGRLAAFLVVTDTAGWASIGTNYSANEALSLRPNNGLLYHVIHHYLVEKKLGLVDHGLSNFPVTPRVETLHRFKIKMGFEALPVQRVFLVNPLLEPFVNHVSWKLAKCLLNTWPRNPLLKKAEVALRAALNVGL